MISLSYNGFIAFPPSRPQAIPAAADFLFGTFSFGEVAIGTNYRIQRATRNILFDEKIGGSIHMAVGQSYLQTGGKNQSSVHWDMISNMKNGGEIIADGKVIYRDGYFLEEVITG